MYIDTLTYVGQLAIATRHAFSSVGLTRLRFNIVGIKPIERTSNFDFEGVGDARDVLSEIEVANVAIRPWEFGTDLTQLLMKDGPNWGSARGGVMTGQFLTFPPASYGDRDKNSAHFVYTHAIGHLFKMDHTVGDLDFGSLGDRLFPFAFGLDVKATSCGRITRNTILGKAHSCGLFGWFRCNSRLARHSVQVLLAVLGLCGALACSNRNQSDQNGFGNDNLTLDRCIGSIEGAAGTVADYRLTADYGPEGISLGPDAKVSPAEANRLFCPIWLDESSSTTWIFGCSPGGGTSR